MASKGLAFLAGALVVLAVPAIVISTKDDSSWESDADPRDGAFVLPELDGLDPSRLAAIELVDRDGTVRIERDGGRWILPGLDGYTAREDRVTELVRGLQTLRIGEPSTKNPERHARVGLVAPDAGGEAAALVRVLDPDGAAICELLLGDVDRSRSADALFVRRPGEDQCWLAEGRVRRETSAASWYDTSVIALDTSEVRRAAIDFEGRPESGYAIERADRTQFGFELTPLPDGREPGAEWQWTALARNLSNLASSDVRRSVDLTGAERATVALETFDGVAVEGQVVRLASPIEGVPGATWASFDARVDELRLTADPALDAAAARATVEALEARVDGWWYEIPAGTAAGLWTPLEDLLAPLPEPPAEAAGPTVPVDTSSDGGDDSGDDAGDDSGDDSGEGGGSAGDEG